VTPRRRSLGDSEAKPATHSSTVASDNLPELARASLAELADRIRRKEVSPTEVTSACLSACERADRAINAFVRIDDAAALAAARRLSDELVRRGPRSPLHGIPLAIKDLIDVAALPTCAGSDVLAYRSAAAADAPVVSRLRSAGAVILGKTHTHEFALGVVTPQCRNPWDTTRAAGGSSGGSAAALATYQCVGALGTDTGGSLRIPSALCGTVTLKPRLAVVPTQGIVPLSPLLDTCGPMARSAADVGLLWNQMRTTPAPPAATTLRVGVVDDAALGELDPDVRAAFGRAVNALVERCDLEVVPVQAPPFEDWNPDRLVPLLADALDVHRAAGWYPRLRNRYGPDMVACLERAADYTVATVIRALRNVRQMADALLACFSECDAVVLPTTPIPAPRIEDAMHDDGTANPVITRALTRLCAPFNWCGLAAVSVPCGLTSGALPIGLQFVSPTEERSLACAVRYEDCV
jgi:aspartyl-tRNA(Asn)/glutamyl-tRNA(Gln) amidotransferase subunit A